ncbi:unnamed protein product [Prorocentrum cordatum]|uniref:Uncharacterized protein n=1 Tax=Prorocentrum cordatum TaxID=2364126 RepID=A0ABN9QE31_9DINO|nr:unnamed protein product [Polarella glacialis]
MLTAPPLRKVPADGRGPAPPPPPQSGDAAEDLELRRLGQQLREQRAQAEAARADADSARGELRRAQERGGRRAGQGRGEAAGGGGRAAARAGRAAGGQGAARGLGEGGSRRAGGALQRAAGAARAGAADRRGRRAAGKPEPHPDSFARVGVASAGILLSSLLAAGSAGCFAFVGAQQREPCLMNGVAALAGGGAPVGGYIMWLGLLAIGIWRWVTGFSIVLFAVADEVSPLEVQRAHLALCRVEEEEVPMGTWQRDAPPLERPLLTLQSTQGSPWLPRIGRFRDPEGQMVQVM